MCWVTIPVVIGCLVRWEVGWTDKNLGPVHTYPDIFESATFSFRLRLPSTRIRRIRQRIRILSNPFFRVKKINCNESDNVWTGECGYFRIRFQSCPVSYRTINRYGGTTPTTGQICRHYRAPYDACSEHILLQSGPGYYSESGYHRMRVNRRIRFEYATRGRGNFWIRK